MKKMISAICVLTLILGVLAICAVSTSAAEAAETVVDVKKGDEVVYTLTLGGVEKPIIGCDFSFYYNKDDSIFEIESVADFTGKTDSSEWQATVNPDLDGQVRGNWSILKGVDFSSERGFLTVTLKALKDGSDHLSYFIRYLYDDSIFDSDDRPQITDYKFTCDVTVNGEKVIEKAQPELNVEESQTTGLFVNSVTGDSKDADASVPGAVAKNPGKSNGSAEANGTPANDSSAVDNNGANNGNSGAKVNGSSKTGSDSKAADAQKADAPAATTADGYFVTATDADGKVTATSDIAPASGSANKGGLSPIVWIIIGLVVLAGGGLVVFFILKKGPNDKNGGPGSGAAQPMNNVGDTQPAIEPDEFKTQTADDVEQ